MLKQTKEPTKTFNPQELTSSAVPRYELTARIEARRRHGNLDRIHTGDKAHDKNNNAKSFEGGYPVDSISAASMRNKAGGTPS